MSCLAGRRVNEPAMIKILHAADLHLDTPFGGLPADKALEQRRSQREMLDKMAEMCRELGVQLVLLSGDLLDSDRSYYETYQALYSALEKMAVPVFIAPGNHDFCGAKSPYSRYKFPDNVHIFSSPRISCVTLEKLGVRVWGAGFVSNRCPPLLDGFAVPDGDYIDIMALHGELGGTDYNPITEASIAASGLDYLALGHVHTFSGIMTAGRTRYAYPGCPMGRGFDETGKKGVIVAQIDRNSVNASFIPLGGREYKIIEAGEDDLGANLDNISESDIVRLVLTGKWRAQPDLGAIRASFSRRCFALTVLDRSSPLRDVWYGMEDDSLRGLFLRRMRAQYDESGTDRELILAAVRYGLDAFDNREVPSE